MEVPLLPFVRRHPRIAEVVPKLLLATSITTGCYFIGDAVGEHVVAPIVSSSVCSEQVSANTLKSEPLSPESDSTIPKVEEISENECRLDLSVGIRDAIGDIALSTGVVISTFAWMSGHGLVLTRSRRGVPDEGGVNTVQGAV